MLFGRISSYLTGYPVIWPDIRLFGQISGYSADVLLFGQISGYLPYNDYLSLEINRISGIQPKKYRPNPILYVCNCFFFTVKLLIDPGNVSVITTYFSLSLLILEKDVLAYKRCSVLSLKVSFNH